MRYLFILFFFVQCSLFLAADEKEIVKFGDKLKVGMVIKFEFVENLSVVNETLDQNKLLINYRKLNSYLNAEYTMKILEMDSNMMPKKVMLIFSKISMNINGKVFTYPLFLNNEYFISYQDKKASYFFNNQPLKDVLFLDKLNCLGVFLYKNDKKTSDNYPHKFKDLSDVFEGDLKITDEYNFFENQSNSDIQHIDKGLNEGGFIFLGSDKIKCKIKEEFKKSRNILMSEIEYGKVTNFELSSIGLPIKASEQTTKVVSEKKHEPQYFENIEKKIIRKTEAEIIFTCSYE